jgi:hypothetical protein
VRPHRTFGPSAAAISVPAITCTECRTPLESKKDTLHDFAAIAVGEHSGFVLRSAGDSDGSLWPCHKVQDILKLHIWFMFLDFTVSQSRFTEQGRAASA